MPVLTTFATVAGSLKTAAETVKSMINLRDAAVFQVKANELQSQISSALADALSAYEAQTAQLQRIRELEKEVADSETWKTQEQRYELKNLGYGALTYMLKPSARGSEPPHWVCAHCFQKRQIFILQFTVQGRTQKDARRGWFCPSCHNEIEPRTSKLQWID
jgi:rubrerythrin